MSQNDLSLNPPNSLTISSNFYFTLYGASELRIWGAIMRDDLPVLTQLPIQVVTGPSVD